MVRAFVQHRPLAAVEGLVRHAGVPPRAAPGRPLPPAPPARGRGARHRRPRPRRRGDRPGRRVLPRLWASADFALKLNSMGDGTCRPAYLDAAARGYLDERRDQLCDEHRAPARRQPAAGPRLQAAGLPGGHRRRAPPGRPPLRRLCARTSPGCARASTPSGCAYELDHRLVRGFDYYTRTTFEFASGAIDAAQNAHRRRRPLRRPGRDARRPADAGHRLRHRDRAGAARLRRRGGVPGRRRRPSTPSSSTSPAATAARDLTAALRRAGLRGRPGVRRPVDEGPDEAGRPLRARRGRADRRPRASGRTVR